MNYKAWLATKRTHLNVTLSENISYYNHHPQPPPQPTSDPQSEAEPSSSGLPDCWDLVHLAALHSLLPLLLSCCSDLDPRRIHDSALLMELLGKEVGLPSRVGQSRELAGISGNIESYYWRTPGGEMREKLNY